MVRPDARGKSSRTQARHSLSKRAATTARSRRFGGCTDAEGSVRQNAGWPVCGRVRQNAGWPNRTSVPLGTPAFWRTRLRVFASGHARVLANAATCLRFWARPLASGGLMIMLCGRVRRPCSEHGMVPPLAAFLPESVPALSRLARGDRRAPFPPRPTRRRRARLTGSPALHHWPRRSRISCVAASPSAGPTAATTPL